MFRIQNVARQLTYTLSETQEESNVTRWNIQDSQLDACKSFCSDYIVPTIGNDQWLKFENDEEIQVV